jgi:hypothetical protein
MLTRPNVRVGALTLEEGQRLAAGRRESLAQGGWAKRRHPSSAALEKRQGNPDGITRERTYDAMLH